MKTIYLIRHAKSDWQYKELTDFERPLNKRGKRDAPFMGKRLNELSFNPDHIISSPAKRTTETIGLICDQVGFPFEKIEFNSSVYAASPKQIIEIINELSNKYDEVVIVGHNPSITLVYEYLSGSLLNNMPTCGMAKIKLDIENWNETSQGIGSEEFLIYPKLFN